MLIHPTVKIHETAIIDEGAEIGKDSKIWHWVHISRGAKIGEGCSFGQNVYVGSNVRIGKNVKVQNNVSIYDNVFLDDNVFCGPSMVFTNVYNPRSEINRKNEYKNTLVEKGVTFGANSTIICGFTIGKYAFIAASALINTHVKPYALMMGIPARQIGWMSIYGERIKLPLRGRGRWECPNTNDIYILRNDNIELQQANN
tara:strand:+ start:502 stop:1101 length:600 start_codon:yes stop_codon:yes gene_type:complete